MEIGSAIKSFRKEKGVGQRELAEKCGISINALSQIETNSTFPQKATIRKICEALDIPQSYLMLFTITDEDVADDKKATFNYLNEALKSFLLDSLKK
jgi:transcriptional regulator with XRE-family HTH domain